jgi:hypothetical protein
VELQREGAKSFVDSTMQAPPHDIAEPNAEVVLADQRHYIVGLRSAVVLIGK